MPKIECQLDLGDRLSEKMFGLSAFMVMFLGYWPLVEMVFCKSAIGIYFFRDICSLKKSFFVKLQLGYCFFE